MFSQTVTVTAPVASATFCAGTSVTVNYTVTSAFGAGNIFTTQLSDATGSFASPVNIRTVSATGNGGGACVIPFTTPSGTGYRVRVISSNPTFTSQSNGVNLTINGLAISTPTTTSLIYCQGEVFNLTYSQNCNFSNTGFNNVYTVQLSDASGSFSSPTTIGTRTATTAAAISCTIPAVPFGTGYRVRIVASNPSVTSPDNGSNITINVPSGSPSVAGNGSWNAYCFNAANNYTLNYQGYFTENNLSFDTRTRYTSTSYPASANTVSGNAYAGCTFTNTNNYSVAFKRTNIPCGYYNITFAHDDEGRIFIDGTQVYYNPYIGGGVQQAYSGFISPTNTVEVRYSNTGGGPGFAAVNITTVNIINAFNPATICAGTTTTLNATNTSTVPLTFSWTPSAFASPTTGTATTVSPTVTTIFTVSANDAVSGCSVSNTVQITVNPVATTTVAATSTLMCSGVTQVTLTAGGAASYTWNPSAGLSAVNGASVIANPTVTTTYTVSGSNNCNTVDASTLITVQTIPASPTPTVYGNGTWNVYCYNDNNTFTNYYGYYTENNLSYTTTARWNANNGPSTCTTTATGLAYSGCSIPSSPWSMRFRRTNIPCGYYQIDITSKDDNLKLFIDGVQVASAGCCAGQTNFWTGFIGPTTLVEFTLVNTGGPGNMGVNFVPISYPVLSPPVTICAGTSTSLTASPFISGANYVWSPAASLTVTTTGTIVPASPTVGTNYTCTVTDPVTTCSAAASVSVSVNPLPTTTVSPTTGTIACSSQSVTLTAGGANTYSWSPAAGLNTTTGTSVIATPTVTTIYTVTGNNNCSGVDATSTITVVPLISSTVFPTSAWNVYCHNNTTFSSYYGYYTHFGTGATGYDFNTATQWVSGAAPSTATANASGTAYQGCTMNATNISLSFKRTGFTCGTYTVVLNNNDDGVAMFLDGVQVAQRTTNSAAAVNLWIGTLNTNSQVEFRLNQGGGGSNLRVTFSAAAATPSLSTWVGGTSTDWFTASNWCGSGIPSSTTDVLVPSSRPVFMPVINAPGAACRSLTVSASSASTAVMAAVPAASLSVNSGNSLDVYGNWINNGVVTAGATSTINLLGTTSSSITGSASETLGSLAINKTGTVTIPASKVVQIAGDGNFTNGIVNQNGTLRFLNGSTTSGANNSSYVNGQVIKVGTQAFTFPVGAGSFYRPIGISAPSVSTDNFTAQYFLADASPSFTHTSKDATIDHIGRCEHWILNRTGGSSNVSVTLSWDATSCGVTNLADLLVARWDAGQAKWKNEGNGGTTGNTTSGTIVSSGAVSVFSPFTLASLTTANPLPIELVSFGCSNSKNSNTLNWITATESNNDYFAIERSASGAEFVQIAKVGGAGNSLSTLHYSYKDENPLRGTAYYRLKQVDFNGKFSYSEICSVTNNGDGNISFFPNPVRNTLTIDYDFSEKPKSNMITVTDVTGKLVSVTSSFSDSKVSLDCSDLAEGIYFLKVFIGDKEVVNKFTVQK
ncbi:MAG TPA: T9SS type A sorting domain-containing protein [Bacteroidia bacterium]|nr:T9SS type A sorting domain-containing protein [Bacteroidia bacterium]